MDLVVSYNGEKYPLPTNSTVRVGRAIDCQIRLFDDLVASRNHCQIINRGGEVSVVDAGSMHGTWVNNVRVGDEPIPIKAGDVIYAGESRMVVTRPLKRLNRRSNGKKH